MTRHTPPRHDSSQRPHAGSTAHGSLIETTTFEEPTELTTELTSLIAAHRESSPTDLPPLYNTIDPDAIEALLRSPGTGISVAFSYAGVDVHLDDNGTLSVFERSEA
ncbi:HalOD1 output domain-containing protein [Haloferacaceae archaeon DSL9]